MTVITHARGKSRLAKMIDSAGGVSVGVALTRARANVAALRGRGLVEVARCIDDLAALKPPTDSEETFRTLQQAYRSANHVIDAAAPFDLPEICAVASSLCDVIDRVSAEAVPDWRIIDVHVRSLRLLHGLPANAADERRQITDHLALMVARKFASPET